ncbi:hypothetical protein I601_0872 [Nocardioides dokdonensis FR1436]|uniref:CNNM transmembrane domain-containing protein n=1 Tax=Nocardioides dokdonensis FR1436 TaxID=1300347 RepID=A0A1A9GIN5_9ACTN|nr:CNNM domain-containing protein [Nocardioides dokdonensis]ANH37315.1 hypothetical protein I601_0872 [Nocardioides dokdonensis FR1436]
MTGFAAIPVTIAIIAASAFFVATEFAVIAARRTRLEAAAADSRSARAALRSASEVPLLLAGSQLGITACTLALGAVTKPAVDHALEPLLAATGLPTYVAAPVSFTLALLLVTFLHLVVGEMAPKSWAISHPERSATLLAVPMRGFMWVFRPVLVLLNEAANRLVRRVGVEPVAEVAIEQDADDLRELVRHSAETGDLDAGSSAQLVGALATSRATVDEVVGERELATVPAGASVAEVHGQARATGHLRILVGTAEAPTGVVHVRDTLTAAGDDPVAPFVRDLLRLEGATTVLDALSTLRAEGTQIALVVRTGAAPTVVTIADLLSRMMPATARAERVVDAD